MAVSAVRISIGPARAFIELKAELCTLAGTVRGIGQPPTGSAYAATFGDDRVRGIKRVTVLAVRLSRIEVGSVLNRIVGVL